MHGSRDRARRVPSSLGKWSAVAGADGLERGWGFGVRKEDEEEGRGRGNMVRGGRRHFKREKGTRTGEVIRQVSVGETTSGRRAYPTENGWKSSAKLE